MIHFIARLFLLIIGLAVLAAQCWMWVFTIRHAFDPSGDTRKATWKDWLAIVILETGGAIAAFMLIARAVG